MNSYLEDNETKEVYIYTLCIYYGTRISRRGSYLARQAKFPI